jgi:DNA-binding MurR/RpiR family transcriptional regulator
MPSEKHSREESRTPPPVSLESRIRDRYEALPSSERKIADLILDFPGEIAAYSATELAALAESSKAAVSRLIRRLGFSNFEEARRAARDAQNWGSPLYLMPRKPDQTGFAARVQSQIEQDLKTISLTMEGLDAETVSEIVTAIWRARRVFVFGYRNSQFLARYLRWQFMQARPGVQLLPGAGETLAEYVSDMNEQDVMVVIGLRRRPPEVSRTLEATANAGAKVLYVTDIGARPQAKATWTLLCAVRGNDMFDRYAGAMSLMHFLGVSLMSRSGDKGRARLKAIERLHEGFHEFG